jgi:hypothetical protein
MRLALPLVSEVTKCGLDYRWHLFQASLGIHHWTSTEGLEHEAGWMPSCGMLRRVALVRTDISEECIAYISRVTRIGEQGTTLAITNSVLRLRVTSDVVPSSPILVILMMETIPFSETSVITRATRRHSPGDGILHSHRRECRKSYIALTAWTL